MKTFLSALISVFLKIRTLFEFRDNRKNIPYAVVTNTGGPMKDATNGIKQVVVTEMILQLGSLTVWCATTPEEQAKGLRPKHYFWRDAASPQANGPFEGVYMAMENYKAVVESMKQDALNKNGTSRVIHVDFRNKRRIY